MFKLNVPYKGQVIRLTSDWSFSTHCDNENLLAIYDWLGPVAPASPDGSTVFLTFPTGTYVKFDTSVSLDRIQITYLRKNRHGAQLPLWIPFCSINDIEYEPANWL